MEGESLAITTLSTTLPTSQSVVVVPRHAVEQADADLEGSVGEDVTRLMHT